MRKLIKIVEKEGFLKLFIDESSLSDIAHDTTSDGTSMRWQPSAIGALQESAEAYLVKEFERKSYNHFENTCH